jgi:hypothetical protein
MHKLSAIVAALGLLSACTSTDTVLRPEGVTSFAGNAIAANTAMQVVDPWQYGVQDTKLKTPAERRPSTSGQNTATTTTSP